MIIFLFNEILYRLHKNKRRKLILFRSTIILESRMLIVMKEDNLARRPIWAREIASSTLAFHINLILSYYYKLNLQFLLVIIIENYWFNSLNKKIQCSWAITSKISPNY